MVNNRRANEGPDNWPDNAAADRRPHAGAPRSAGTHSDVLAADSASHADILQREAAWIASLQFESGAIPTYSEPLPNYDCAYKVIPYFAHFGLLGLLEAPGHAPTVRKYMDWYFARLNRTATQAAPAGSIFDIAIAADRRTEATTGDCDSTDSYASTFLNVLRKYAEMTGDIAYVQAHQSDIGLIAGAMLATKQADGLTWAKPTHKVKYLMDNTEVYKGLDDMVWISEAIFADETAADVYRKHMEDVRAGIENELWSESRQAYAYAKTEDGMLIHSNWSRFYPDAPAQLFPIWTGILEPSGERARKLYETFNAHHSGWQQLEKSDAFPWAIVAYTAARMGDSARVIQFLECVRTAYVDNGHPWPWYVMESGCTMLAAAIK
ncbi:hypothetical protein [Paenibacillus sp. GCM10027626]|uniref:hypothetical protein n=1 Tax=Paenibacillus sp. GCM10027626 TaxID=3273411 RepID=UPI0036295413